MYTDNARTLFESMYQDMFLFFFLHHGILSENVGTHLQKIKEERQSILYQTWPQFALIYTLETDHSANDDLMEIAKVSRIASLATCNVTKALALGTIRIAKLYDLGVAVYKYEIDTHEREVSLDPLEGRMVDLENQFKMMVRYIYNFARSVRVEAKSV